MNKPQHVRLAGQEHPRKRGAHGEKGRRTARSADSARGCSYRRGQRQPKVPFQGHSFPRISSYSGWRASSCTSVRGDCSGSQRRSGPRRRAAGSRRLPKRWSNRQSSSPTISGCRREPLLPSRCGNASRPDGVAERTPIELLHVLSLAIPPGLRSLAPGREFRGASCRPARHTQPGAARPGSGRGRLPRR
jgi:hypothetical protein